MLTLFLYLCLSLSSHHAPPPPTNYPPPPPKLRRHLERITSVGPRPVGSRENEVLTVGYLLEQIEHVRRESAAGPHRLTVDVQRPTGSFSIDFLGGFTSFYDRVTNVAVRLEPKGGAQHLMLANCHFDTVANSPG